jgi:hypothetical protein
VFEVLVELWATRFQKGVLQGSRDMVEGYYVIASTKDPEQDIDMDSEFY